MTMIKELACVAVEKSSLVQTFHRDNTQDVANINLEYDGVDISFYSRDQNVWIKNC